MKTAIVACCLSLLAGVAPQVSAADLAVVQRLRLGGEGAWDYLSYDPQTARLFIPRSTHVQVVDPATGTVVGDIADTPGVHGVALATGLDKAYTSNGRDNSLTVFSPSSLKTLGKVLTPEGKGPDFITYDPVTRQVVAFNGKSHNASLVDALTDKLVATVPLGGEPEGAVADGVGGLFVNLEDTGELVHLDLRAARVVHRWRLAGCDRPVGLALDAAQQRLLVGCRSQVLVVVNAENGKTLASLPIGEGVDANAFDATTHLAFSSQKDGTLVVVEQDGSGHYVKRQTLATAPGAGTLALNPQTHQIYLVTAEFEEPPAGAKNAKRVPKPGSFTLLVVGDH
jgi:DNA-binding beta-propeller fold protein YncE